MFDKHRVDESLRDRATRRVRMRSMTPSVNRDFWKKVRRAGFQKRGKVFRFGHTRVSGVVNISLNKLIEDDFGFVVDFSQVCIHVT